MKKKIFREIREKFEEELKEKGIKVVEYEPDPNAKLIKIEKPKKTTKKKVGK